MTKEAPPPFKGFKYIVKINASIPRAWADFLREVAGHHYDWLCRASAKEGVVNGLRNTACDSEYPSSISMEWGDFDLLAKIMEQAAFHATSPELLDRAVAIQGWIRQSKGWISDRAEALAQWDAAQISPVQG